jgi:hypothetical protein
MDASGDGKGECRPGRIVGYLKNHSGLARTVQPRQPGRPFYPSAGLGIFHQGGAAMFRLSRKGEGIEDADTIDGAREIVRGQPSGGRYDVDEIRAEPFPSGYTSRAWGRLIRRPDGRVKDEPWPWEDSAE